LANLEDPEQPSREVLTLPLSEDQTTVTSAPSTVPISWLSATSALNPFFGYPVSTSSSNRLSLSLPHGRRRKRDLARTLLILFWMRWQTHITIGIFLTMIVFVARVVFRKGVLRFPKEIARWYMLLPKRRLSSK
jgi:retinaldehyde-binding protein 1